MYKRMVHPKHGVHICYGQIEYENCLKNGWKDEEKQPDRPVLRVKKKGKK